jgi:NAD(P)-dependent dehydrogenase (short-subunit alcohol dehydrogenase family)
VLLLIPSVQYFPEVATPTYLMLVNFTDQGRIGEPEDIANAVVFLASPESGWITAQVLTVDGGRMDYIGHA